MRKTALHRVVHGFIVIGTIIALMLAGGAPTENTHGEGQSVVAGVE